MQNVKPVAKVTAATAAAAGAQLVGAVFGWGPEIVAPLTTIATFAAGWLAPPSPVSDGNAKDTEGGPRA